MTIQGYQFDKCKVTPEADAALYYQLNNKQNRVIAGYKNEMNVTSSGLNVYVDTGCALVMGRYCEITNQEQLSVMANTEGYVCITIDLTETNTAEGVPGSADYVVTNNQLRVELVTELVQQDLFNDGQVYTFPLAQYTSSGTNVSIVKDKNSYFDVNGGFYTVFKGANFFKSMHEYTWDEKHFKNKIVLIWSRWNKTTGVPEDRHFKTIEIDRHALDEVGQGRGWRIDLEAGETYKYFYLRNNQIVGYDDNVGTQTWCLRQIYVY